MNTTSPLALPPSIDAADVAKATLDQRIAWTEARLMAREQDLRSAGADLLQRLRRATEPRRLVLPLLGGAIALLAAGWAWRRIGSARPARATAASVGGAARPRSEVPWVRAAALVWPMLPAAWRARVGPGTASLVAGIGLPLAEQLLRPKPAPALPAVASVDWTRFAGDWFELARLRTPFDAADGSRIVNYTLDGEPAALSQRRASGGAQTPRIVQIGVQLVPDSGGAHWMQSLLPPWLRWLPLAWAERRIVVLDDDYSLAMVGSPQRDALSLLSRQPRMEPAMLQALVQRARELGFAVDRLSFDAAD